jgi:polysaccharide export outer membrane protein
MILIARKSWRAIVASLTGLALVACASHPDAPASPEDDSGVYVIGPLDTVEVFVWGDPDLSREVTVRPDGRISTPLVSDMQAAGKTPGALSDDIAAALRPYIQDPLVTVIVGGFAGPVEQQIRVVGEVNEPAALPYRRNLTLLDVMLTVGGLTEFADGNRAVLVRGEGDTRKTYRVRLEDLLRDSDIDANVGLLPGDVIMVPETFL